ncbi:MAG TPA: alpha/beta hydrolase [Phytomonospora sp.]
MAEYVDLNGVNTWYDERGEGEPVLLLHGGMSNAGEFEGNLALLADRFHVFLPERRGHGRTADVEGPLTIALQADDTIAFIEKIVGTGPVRLVGYSLGATVALRVALLRPDLVERLVLVSGTFANEGFLFGPGDNLGEEKPFVPPQIKEMYGALSPDGPEHIYTVLRKLGEAAVSEPGLTPADLARVAARTLLVLGDDDLVKAEHTLELFRALPESELAVVPGTSHLLFLEKPELYTRVVTDFLTTDAVATMMPIARAKGQPFQDAS